MILLTIVLVAAIIRIHLLDVPLERDEGEYAYTGQLILQGIPPYSLVYNMKMPGIYAAYALILAVFGQTYTGIHLGLLVINAATTILLFLLVQYLMDSWSGLFSAAAFAIMSLTLPVQGLFANAEHFVILFAVPGIFLLVLAVDRNNMIFLLASAILLGIGFMMKQHGAAFILFAGLYLFFSQLQYKPFKLKCSILKMILFIIGAILPFGMTCVILWRLGVFEKFWFWTVTYAREYISLLSIWDALPTLKLKITWMIGSAVLIWISAFIGLIALFANKKIQRHRLFVAGFLFFSFLATCPGFYFRPHYFILLLPAIALLSGVGLSGIRQALEHQMPAITKDLIAVLLALAVPLYTLYHQKDYLFESDPATVSRMTYGFNPFPESLEIAEYIKSNSSSTDTIAIFGSEPQIFFYANRHSATSYIYMYPLMEPHPYALQMQEEMIQQIEAAEPRFLLFVKMPFSWLRKPTSNTLIFDWFEQYRRHYNRVGIIDFVSEDTIVHRWGQDAANYRPRSRLIIVVFQRNK